eukprot:7065722-Karenia_brevis.AAC.1
MRLHRRIHGQMRFDSSAEPDHAVRHCHQIPSIDCCIMRKRLMYLRRVLMREPPTLMALLHCRSGATRLPWVALILSDLRFIRER